MSDASNVAVETWNSFQPLPRKLLSDKIVNLHSICLHDMFNSYPNIAQIRELLGRRIIFNVMTRLCVSLNGRLDLNLNVNILAMRYQVTDYLQLGGVFFVLFFLRNSAGESLRDFLISIYRNSIHHCPCESKKKISSLRTKILIETKKKS